MASSTEQDERAVFFVKGRRAKGSVTIKNPGKQRAKVKSLDVNAPSLRDASGQPLKQVQVLAHLNPGDTQQCTVDFEVDPTLAAGTYEGELICGKMLKQPFVLHVIERIDITFYPNRLIIHGEPSEQLDKEMIISNQGNVPVKLNRQHTIMLSEVGEVSRVVGSTLYQEAKAGAMNVLDTFVTKLQEAVVRPMTLTFADENLEITPGETKKFQIHVHLPGNLKAKRSYRGRISLYNKTLSALIHCAENK